MSHGGREKRQSPAFSKDHACCNKAPFVVNAGPVRLSKMLCDVVSTGSNFDPLDWCKVIDLYAYQLANAVGLEYCDKVTKFALTIAMIGSQHAELFQHVFRLFSDWEQIKGPYWIIQTELQRHYCLHIIRTKLPRLVMSQSTSLIDRLFSTIDLEDIDNKTLRDELPKLQEELQALVDELMGIRSSKRREEILDNYCKDYPLEAFSQWFLHWAHSRFGIVYRSCASQSIGPSIPDTASSEKYCSVGIQTESNATATATAIRAAPLPMLSSRKRRRIESPADDSVLLQAVDGERKGSIVEVVGRKKHVVVRKDKISSKAKSITEIVGGDKNTKDEIQRMSQEDKRYSIAGMKSKMVADVISVTEEEEVMEEEEEEDQARELVEPQEDDDIEEYDEVDDEDDDLTEPEVLEMSDTNDRMVSPDHSPTASEANSMGITVWKTFEQLICEYINP